MAGPTLTTASSLTCPHGGTVTVIPSNPGVLVGGAPIATVADQFVITGCPFMLPTVPPIPSPCLTIDWIVPDLVSGSNSSASLSESSAGVCMSALQLPQGPPIVGASQGQVHSQ